MNYNEARKINAMRRIKRILIDVEASIANNKPHERICESISIKEIIKRNTHG